MLSIAIIINNYFHDVATAVLLASAVIMWVLERRAASDGGAALAGLASAYPLLTRFAWGAVAWIVVGGIPRTIFFSRYEWDPAVVHGIVPALIVKHTLMVVAIVLGALLWRRASRAVRSDLA